MIFPAKQSKYHMASIQLPDGKKIHGRKKQSQETREQKWVMDDFIRIWDQCFVCSYIILKKPKRQVAPKMKNSLLLVNMICIIKSVLFKYSTIRAAANPASGPAIPTSKYSFLDLMGSNIRIKAPIEPIANGIPMKPNQNGI